MKFFSCRIFIFYIFSVFIGFAPVSGIAGEVSDGVPAKIDPKKHYVIYMHSGRFAKGRTTYTDGGFGTFDHPKIVAALKDPDYHLIAYIRPYKEELDDASRQLGHEVQALLGEGVPPENITLIGFAEGSEIVFFASSILEKEKLNIVMLGGCIRQVVWNASIAVWGRVLSLYDADDDFAASCKVLLKRDGKIPSFKETVLNSGGKGHGLFFQPDDLWLVPLKKWIKEK